MKHKQLLDALSDVDERYIESAATAMEGRKRYRRPLSRVVALVACICLLIVGTVGGVALSRWINSPPTPETPPMLGTIPMLNALENSAALSGIRSVTDGSLKTVAASEVSPIRHYELRLVISARVTEVLPDIYSLPWNESDEYHILRLKVNEIISGEGQLDEIFFLLSADLSTELTSYTDIVFVLEQVGCENYLMVNQTKGKMEAFDMVFTSPVIYRSQASGYIVPFTDGVLDTSIWGKEGWHERYIDANNLSDKPGNYVDFPAYRGCTLEDTKAIIRETAAASGTNIYRKVFSLSDFDFDGAQDTFAYVAPFENGTFIQFSFFESESPDLWFIRFINGFPTGEIITFNGTDRTVVYSEEKYTEKDLQSVPDIGTLIETLDFGSLTPPHFDPQKTGQVGYSVGGWYRKAEGKVYGIVKVEWLLYDRDAKHHVQDDLYYLAYPDGNYREVDREELRSIIGDDERISDYEYGTSFNRATV